jgi:hypothetical protein
MPMSSKDISQIEPGVVGFMDYIREQTFKKDIA